MKANAQVVITRPLGQRWLSAEGVVGFWQTTNMIATPLTLDNITVTEFDLSECDRYLRGSTCFYNMTDSLLAEVMVWERLVKRGHDIVTVCNDAASFSQPGSMPATGGVVPAVMAAEMRLGRGPAIVWSNKGKRDTCATQPQSSQYTIENGWMSWCLDTSSKFGGGDCIPTTHNPWINSRNAVLGCLVTHTNCENGSTASTNCGWQARNIKAEQEFYNKQLGPGSLQSTKQNCYRNSVNWFCDDAQHNDLAMSGR
ncbi:hypothetical protein HDV01_001741 [Terramyces sp. JEL0728]|nr:hypothetical protein HDV01_001741 [Terramyces sp. JEL0728]